MANHEFFLILLICRFLASDVALDGINFHLQPPEYLYSAGFSITAILIKSI